MGRNDLISREALKQELAKCGYDIADFGSLFFIIDNAPTVEIPNYGGQVVPDTLQGWIYEDRQISIEEYLEQRKGERQ